MSSLSSSQCSGVTEPECFPTKWAAAHAQIASPYLLHKPLWFNDKYIMAVLARGEYEFVIDQPFWHAIEERTRRSGGECTPACPRRLSCITPAGPSLHAWKSPNRSRGERGCSPVPRWWCRARTDPWSPTTASTRLARVAPHVYEVLETPQVRKVARLPSVVHREQCQVVPLQLVELGLLWIRLRLLFFRPVEDALDGILDGSEQGLDIVVMLVLFKERLPSRRI